MKMMTGNNKDFYNPSISMQYLYNQQAKFQERVESSVKIGGKDVQLPVDNPEMFQYHMTQLTEELGEVLKSDKRWKTHRNNAFDPENKLDELADCFIVLLNITMWSGFTYSDISNQIDQKIRINNARLDERMNNSEE